MMTTLPGQLQRAKTLTEQAAEEIRARIVRGDFELGAPLSENALAATLGVSKTPIREALLQLKMEGLVSIQPQRGSFVFDMSPEEIKQLGELREMMEVAALRLTIERNRDALIEDLRAILSQMHTALEAGDVAGYRSLDGDFHRTFFDHCGNGYIADCYESFSFRVQALRARLSVDAALNERSFADHERIVALIVLGRIDDAMAVLVDHVLDTTTRSIAIKSGEQAIVDSAEVEESQ